MTDRWTGAWWLIIVAATLLLLPAVGQRMAVELSADSVELIMDLEDVNTIARWWGRPTASVLDELKARGLTSVGVPEMTLERLHQSGRLTLLTGAEALARARVNDDGPVRSLADHLTALGYLYAIVDDSELAAALAERAAVRPALSFVGSRQLEEGTWVLEFGGSHESLRQAGLGFDVEEIELVAEAGLLVVPRPRSYPGITDQQIEQLVASFGDRTNLVICHGAEVVGYPERVSAFGRELSAAGYVLGLVEAPSQLGFIMQKGSERLAEDMQLRVVRVYTIPASDLDRLSLSEAVDRLTLAVYERNIRALYVRPLAAREYQGVERETVLSLVERTAANLRSRGFQLGPAQPFARWAPVGYQRSVAALATIIAGAMILFRLFGIAAWRQLALILGLLAIYVGGVRLYPGAAHLLAALGAAVSFPVLAVTTGSFGAQTSSPIRASVQAVLVLLRAVAISLVGAVVVTVLLGDTRFILELSYFRGVKVSYLAPIAILGGLWVRDHFRRNGTAELKAFLTRRLAVKDLWLLVLLAAVLYIYLARAGHEGSVPVPGVEALFRDVLQQTLGVRPRFKEFSIGHPAMVMGCLMFQLGIVAGSELWRAAAIVGQVSVVNSFAHLRTPFALSLLRSAHGAWLGAAIGLVLGLVVRWLINVSRVNEVGGNPCPKR